MRAWRRGGRTEVIPAQRLRRERCRHATRVRPTMNAGHIVWTQLAHHDSGQVGFTSQTDIAALMPRLFPWRDPHSAVLGWACRMRAHRTACPPNKPPAGETFRVFRSATVLFGAYFGAAVGAERLRGFAADFLGAAAAGALPAPVAGPLAVFRALRLACSAVLASPA
jgi:hypothetical protein